MSEVERLDETFATDPERDLDAWLEQMSDCEIRFRSAASETMARSRPGVLLVGAL